MSEQDTKNTELLSGRVTPAVKEAFWATKPKGTSATHLMTTAANLWINLPRDLQKRLLDAEDSDPDLFVEAVRQIAREQFELLSKGH